MGWWGALFSSKRIVNEAMDTVKDIRTGIDHAIFTDQETAEMATGISEIVLKRAELALNESSFRSMSRRIISVMVVCTCVFLTAVLVVLYLLEAKGVQGIWDLLNFWKIPLGIVIAFYLGYYGWSEIRKAG